MTPTHPTPAASSGAVREITEVGPFTGATSFPVGTGLVFVSADGTWGRPAA